MAEVIEESAPKVVEEIALECVGEGGPVLDDDCCFDDSTSTEELDLEDYVGDSRKGGEPSPIIDLSMCSFRLQETLEKIRQGTTDELCWFLEREKPSLNIIDSYGRVPLHVAMQFGRFDMMDVLMKYGASPNMFNNSGTTIMHLAAEENNLLILKLRSWYGGNFTSVDFKAFQPLHRAIMKKKREAVEYILSVETRPLDPAISCIRDVSLLHFAAYYNCHYLLNTLLEEKRYQLLINEETTKGLTPLDYAVRRGYDVLASFLRRHGATSGSSN